MGCYAGTFAAQEIAGMISGLQLLVWSLYMNRFSLFIDFPKTFILSWTGDQSSVHYCLPARNSNLKKSPHNFYRIKA